MLDRVFRPPPSRWPYAVAAGFAACMIAVAVVQFQPSIASAPAETAGFAAIRAFLGAECQLDGDDVSPLMSMLRGVGVDDVDDLVLLDDDDVKKALEGQRSLSVVRRKRLRRKLLDCVETRLRRDGTRPKGLVESVAFDLWKTYGKKHVMKLLGTVLTLGVAALRRRMVDERPAAVPGGEAPPSGE